MLPTLARAILALLVGIGIVAGMGGAVADPVQESTDVETTHSGDVSTMCGSPGDGDGGDGGGVTTPTPDPPEGSDGGDSGGGGSGIAEPMGPVLCD